MSALAIPKLPEIIRPQRRLYTPPAGYYDLPFSWVFDASNLSTTNSNPNNLVYLQGGYGDFVLRRVVGLSNILAGSSTYQIQDRNLSNIQFLPVVGASADDIGMVPETLYQELGAIRFSLGPITKEIVVPTNQVVFQGARRMKGNPPRNPNYKAIPKSYTYIMGPVAVTAPIGSMRRIWQPVLNYDFELYNIIVMSQGGIVTGFGNETGSIFYANLTSGALTITVNDVASYSASVSGSNVTINIIAGDGDGAICTAVNNLAALQGILYLTTNAPVFGVPELGTFVATGGGGGWGNSGGASNVVLYDQNKVAISNMPVCDVFMDGYPNFPGLYGNGSITPPLWYQKNSQIQMDVYSNIASGFINMYFYLVGRKYYPC